MLDRYRSLDMLRNATTSHIRDMHFRVPCLLLSVLPHLRSYNTQCQAAFATPVVCVVVPVKQQSESSVLRMSEKP